MAISRKPKPDISEAAINAVIEKGGSVAKDKKTDLGRKNLQLRLEPDLINLIDEDRKKRSVPPSRHTWILEAIHEKLNNK